MSDNINVGLLGAYERDNFGDILFLERTERFLRAAGLAPQPLTPFRSTPELLSHRPARTLADAVRESSVDAVWAVGGEVGAVAIYAAYLMLDVDVRPPGYGDLSRSARRRTIRRESGARLTDLAYLPRMSSVKGLRALPLVVNSVGLSGIDLLQSDMRATAVSALREADYVSVRDTNSSRLLEGLGIQHNLAPDLVHTLRLDHQEWTAPGKRVAACRSGHVVVQMSEAVLASRVDELASALTQAPELRGRELRFLPAGLAPRHDSLELYSAVIEAVKRRRPDIKATISAATTPLEKVRELATSALVLGTSLHAMIVSMTFDVPHVGLEIEKVSRYATSWGDVMPTEVKTVDIPAAVTRAFELEPSVRASSFGEGLARRAAENIELAVKAMRPDLASRAERDKRRSESARAHARVQRSPALLATRALRYTFRPLS